MNFPRIWALTKIVFRAHIFNWLWRSRARRSEVRTSVLSKAAPEYFKRYLPKPGEVPDMPIINNDKNDKIFTIWLQGEDKAPPIAKACFRSIRNNCKQELIILDESNLFQWVDLPERIISLYRRGKIGNAHFADICRVDLLYRHGGYWMDATDFATGPIPKWIEKEDFFVYLVGNRTGQKYMYMQNCFIRARKGSYLLAAWRAMIINYWMHESASFDYFMHQMLFQTLVENDPRAREEFAKMPHVDQWQTHILWHNYKFKKFDQKEFDELTSGAFFQKTSHNDKPRPGTYSGVMADMYQDTRKVKSETRKAPAISIIIPVYNVEQYLRRCLDSVLNQTFDNWQAICVNDGSPDNSATILEEYAARDPRFEIITKENGGLSDARNFGMKAARGEYVLFLDSDDFIHPQTMEITYNLAKQNNSDIVSFRKALAERTWLVIRQFFGEKIGEIHPIGMHRKYNLKNIKSKTVDDIFPYVTERSHRLKFMQIKHAYVWQNLYRREIIKDIPFIKGIIMEDFPWWSAVWLKHPRTTITRLPLYYYIPQLGSIMASSKRLRKVHDLAVGMKATYELYKKKATPREMRIWRREFLWPYVIWMYRDIGRIHDAADKDAAQKIMDDLNRAGVFGNVPAQRAKKYQKRIRKFISEV